jgi:hypothetical protein
MKTRFLLAVCLFALSGAAWAQTACPMGVAPGSPQCGPSPSYHGVTPTSSAPQYPQVRWMDRWGAIATDATVGGVGTAERMSSKRQAQKAALAACRKRGGGGCKISLSFRNQCGAMAWGASHMSTAHAATIETASELAIRSCSESTSDCQIYYADCSLPHRIQ